MRLLWLKAVEMSTSTRLDVQIKIKMAGGSIQLVHASVSLAFALEHIPVRQNLKPEFFKFHAVKNNKPGSCRVCLGSRT